MKTKLLSLVLIIFSFSLFGKPVDESRAKMVGLNFLKYKTNSVHLKNVSDLQLTYTANSKIGNSTGEKVMFYVLNVNTVGFIIVAGDDTVTPILGYSDSIYILQIQTDKGILTKKLIITK
ncbi:MAG: Spi family protease inhibitor [Flavobacterium sp.]